MLSLQVIEIKNHKNSILEQTENFSAIVILLTL